MSDNKRYIPATIAVAAMLTIAAVPMVLQQAFAHAHTNLTLADEHVAGKQISVVMGHTNEPTYGVKPGIHDGKHNLEVMLSDAATKLPLTGAQLQADKYYFKDIGSFNKAKSVNDADEIVKGVKVGGVFDDAGHYVTRQVQKDGIYGYRLYGTIDYFGVATMSVDTTMFCRASDGDTSKFNSPGWSGGYGCTGNISNTAFPSKNNEIRSANAVANTNSAVQQISFENQAGVSANNSQSSLQSMSSAWFFGSPIAAVGAVFGWRSLKKSKKEDSF